MIGTTDIRAVDAALNSDRLTQGPLVDEFEQQFADRHSMMYGVAVSSGTAALHCAIKASFHPKPDNCVVVPTMTFAATANAVVMAGGRPIFADVDPFTLLTEPHHIADACGREFAHFGEAVGIVCVDYAGQLSDATDFLALGGLPVVVDACHSVGLRPRKGARAYCYSFHAAKNITTGEGGMILTDDVGIRDECRRLRNHGRIATGEEYGMDQVELGYNYRITDFQCALGLSQLKWLDGWMARRSEIALAYDESFSGTEVVPVARSSPSASHLYVVSVPNRSSVRARLDEEGIGTAIHFRPVHQLAYYRTSFQSLPVAERLAESIMSIPMGPWLRTEDAEAIARRVVEAVQLEGISHESVDPASGAS